MDGKKKYIVLLVLLFLGFSVVSFAGGNDETATIGNNDSIKTPEEKAEEIIEKVENNPTEEIINEALQIIEEVEQEERQEFINRVENTRPAIDPSQKIASVENMVLDATSKENIKDAKTYFDNNDVENSTNELDEGNVKTNLDNRINKLKEIFADETSPKIEGIKDNEITKEDVKLTITDELDIVKNVKLNGKEIEFTDTFDEEGLYEIIVTDLAQNKSQVTFIIDKTKPVIEGLTNGKHYDELTINVIEDNEFKIEVQKNHKDTTIYENNTKITEEGTYKITVTDEAGNQIILWTAIDKTNPEILGFENETITNACTKVTISDRYLTEVIINDEKFIRDDFKHNANNEYHVLEKEICDANVYQIVAKDKIGNETIKTLTIDKQQATMNYSSLRVDGNPVVKKEDKNNYYYLTNGDIIEYAIAFNEKLKEPPIVNINGKEVPMALILNPKETYRDEKRIYLYEGKMELTKELNITNGVLNITLTNVYDIAGNETTDEKTLNQTPTSNHRIVVYDSEAPKLNYVAIISKGEGKEDKYIKNGETVRFLVAFNEEIIIPENKDERTFILQINGKNVKFQRSQGAGYEYIAEYTIPKSEEKLKEGELTFSISGYKDFTGNEGQALTIANHKTYNKVIYDRTPVTINGIEKEIYTYGKEQIIPTTNDTDVKIVELTKDNQIVKDYNLGTKITEVGEYKLVVKDKANNITTKQFTIEKQQIEFEMEIGSEIEFDNKEKKVNVKVLNLQNESDYEIEEKYYIMREDGTYYGPRKEVYAKEFGQYKVKVTVKSKNKNYKDSETKILTFKIVDTTSPTLEITWNEKNNTTYVRGNDLSRLIYTIKKDDKIIHTVDSETCGCGNYFSITWLAKTYGDGEYTVEVVDKGENKTTKTANIDTIKPYVTNINKELLSNENVKVTLTFSEEIKALDGWIKKTNTEYEKKYTKEYKEEVITFKDLVSLENTYEFTIDAKSPEVILNKNDITLEEDKDEFIEPEFEIIDNSKYTKELLSGEVNTHKVGTYILKYRITDEVGNYTDKEVTVKVVDTQLPQISGIKDGEFYNTKDTHAIPQVSDKNLSSVKLIKHSPLLGDVDVTKLLFKNGQEIKEYGSYTLIVKDKYNEPIKVNFTVDNIEPKVLLLDKLEYIQGNIIPIKPVIIEEHIDEIIVKKNGKIIEYKLNEQLKENANYEITVIDKAKNTTRVNFTIDSENPLIFNPIGTYREFDINVIDKNYNKENVVVLKKEKDIEGPNDVKIPYYKKYDLSGTKLTEEGEYIIVVYDKAYNVGITKVVIDLSKPTFNIENGKSYYEVTPEVYDNSSVVPVLLKNGVPQLDYKLGDKITEEGVYSLSVTDVAGNYETVKFYVDRTAPTIDTSAIQNKIGAIENSEPLKVVAKANDNIDGMFDINPIEIKHNKKGNLDKVYITPEYVGTYTLIYQVSDKAGNKSEIVEIKIKVVEAEYSIIMENKTFEYTGENAKIDAIIKREDGETVEGEIEFKIKKDGKPVDGIKEVGIYTITASSKSYSKIEKVTAIYTIKKAKLTVEMYELKKDDEISVDWFGNVTNTVEKNLVFKNSDGKEVKGVESTTLLYKEVDGIYIPYTKVKKGKYVYSVSVNNKNYEIESVGNLNKVPLPNTIISKEYEF